MLNYTPDFLVEDEIIDYPNEDYKEWKEDDDRRRHREYESEKRSF